MKLAPRRGSEPPRIHLAPLIDVVFLILVAFIEASVFAEEKTGLPIELPRAAAARAQSGELVVLEIDREGHLFLAGEPVDGTELERRLAELRRARPSSSLLVRADRRADVGPLVDVLDLAHRLVFPSLTIATAPDEVSASP